MKENDSSGKESTSRRPPYVVNVGLPRTGTSSFAAATEMLGFQSLHIWHEAEKDPEVLNMFIGNQDEARNFLSQYHTLSDTPFYAFRDVFEKYYPDTLLVYTTRSKESWVQSMINHGNAGGVFLSGRYDVEKPPYTESRVRDLEKIYDLHHEKVCRGLPAIDLASEDDDLKWKLLCSGLPDSPDCIQKTVGRSWPHENSYTERMKRAREKRVGIPILCNN